MPKFAMYTVALLAFPLAVQKIMINSFTGFGIFGETNYGILFYQLLIFYVSMNIRRLLTSKEKLFLRKRRGEWVVKGN